MRWRLALLLSGVLAWSCTAWVETPEPEGEEDGGAGGGINTEGGPGCAVESVLQTRCSSCHGSPVSGGAPVSFTLDVLRGPSLRDAAQTYAQRCVARMQDTVAPMPPVGSPSATSEEAQLISDWIAAGMPACGTSNGNDAGTQNPNPNLIPQNELFSCSNASSDAPTRIRRLNRWNWTRNVGGAVTRDWTGFSFFDNPFDPSAGERYSTYATDETLDEATIELFLPVLVSAGPPWAGPYAGDNRLERLQQDQSLRCMYDDDVPTQQCIRHYLSEFLLHGVYFRPATTAELDRLQTFATTVLSEEPTPDGGTAERIHSITRISNAAWLTAGALFRTELGDPNSAGRAPLTDWELAQQLAYAVGARAPGATPTWVYPDFSAPMQGHLADIADAAADGGIRNAAVVAALFKKHGTGVDPTRFDLVQDYRESERANRGQYWLGDGINAFFREWLGYSKVPEIFKERPEATSKFDDGGTSPYRAQLSAYGELMDSYYSDEGTLIQQMEDLVARVVNNDQDVLKNLLTTREFYLASNAELGPAPNAVLYMGQIYGTEQAIADSQAARWITLPADERAGVLTHPAFLGSHGGNFEDDPSIVHRGKWVRENLLCGYIPPLSEVRVMAQVGPHADNKSARMRLDDATGKPECQGCHGLMNPLGYPFEIYNHAGYLRQWDKGADGGRAPPNGSSILTGMPEQELNGPVRDAVELSQKLAQSTHVKRCFIRHAFRYFMGRNENRSDACTLAAMEQAYDSNSGSFFKMMDALTASESWTSRRVPGAGE